MMRKIGYILLALSAAAFLAGCSARLEPIWTPTGLESNIIRIGGASTASVVLTKANADDKYTDAELNEWMIPTLQAGVGVMYGNFDQNGAQTNKRQATLMLDPAFVYGKTDPARYTFTYSGNGDSNIDGKPAEWYGNGMHFFEGSFVPDEVKSATPPSTILSADQSGDNYTLLTQYLGVPVDCRISATIERVRIPFQHRLSRVIAYVLLDPKVSLIDKDVPDEKKVTLRSISFSKVKVLEYVDEDNHPHWTESRRVKPHVLGVNRGLDTEGHVLEGVGSFVLLHHRKNDTYLAPSNIEYAAALQDPLYEQIVYPGGAPSFDIIVQPTYSDVDHVMYDEAGYPANATTLAGAKNKIEFEIELSNNLHYTKEFVFDLDANYQTVVYLRIEPEAVNYDSSGSTVWEASAASDGLYGVNNINGNTLSKVGSSWQRAFRNKTSSIGGVTDGSDYDQDGEDDHIDGKDGQYVSGVRWVEAFLEATADGAHHGDYFILDSDITINVPAGFVFTGHLDAQGHTITLKNNSLAGLDGSYDAAEGTANVHSEGGILVPVKGYRAELLNLVVDSDGKPLFVDNAPVSGYIYHCRYSNDVLIPDVVTGGIPTY